MIEKKAGKFSNLIKVTLNRTVAGQFLPNSQTIFCHFMAEYEWISLLIACMYMKKPLTFRGFKTKTHLIWFDIAIVNSTMNRFIFRLIRCNIYYLSRLRDSLCSLRTVSPFGGLGKLWVLSELWLCEFGTLGNLRLVPLSEKQIN